MEFGHYSRLEQLQKRLWYFSYLNYPISSLYHLLTNSSRAILSSDNPSIFYTRPCQGCSRCQPKLLEEYRRLEDERQNRKTPSFFSKFYQSNRHQVKSSPPLLSPPIENPDCGVEYPLERATSPVQMWGQSVR